MTADELKAIEDRAAKATPGPWYFVATDDDVCMNARYVGTIDRGDGHDNKRGMEDSERCGEVVAITLLQSPRLADHESARWDENTDFIASARTDVPALVAEVSRLRDAIGTASNCLDALSLSPRDILDIRDLLAEALR